MVYRFVCVIVVIIPQEILWCHLEEISKTLFYSLFTTHQRNHAFYIMGNEPALLIGITLYGSVPVLQPSLTGPWLPLAVVEFGPKPIHRVIKYILVTLSP